MTEFERDLLKNVIHLDGRAGEESLTASDIRQLIKNSLSFHAQRAARVGPAKNANAIKHNVGFFQETSKFIESVTRVIVLAIANQQERAFWVGATLYLFHPKITGVIQRRVVLSLHEHKFVNY